MYDFTCHLATLEPPPPHLQKLFAALRNNQQGTDEFFAALTGATPMPVFMDPENIHRLLASAEART
jgi:hypothetical protein